jgi:hypothetical protein
MPFKPKPFKNNFERHLYYWCILFRFIWGALHEYIFEPPLSVFLRYINWRLVRSLGELQILTRASYITLILVPILAGVWPAVRLIVNQPSKEVTEAATILDRASARFSEVLSSPSSVAQKEQVGSLHAAGDEFRRQVNQNRMDYEKRAIETPRMPAALAIGFIAALVVVLAHLVYQMSAPPTVRRTTLNEYIAEKKDDYSKHRPFDAVPEAMQLLEGEKRRKPKDYLVVVVPTDDPDELRNYLKGRTPFQQEELREACKGTGTSDASKILRMLASMDEERDLATRAELERQKNVAIIAKAAEIEYLRDAKTKWPIMILTALLYGFAIYLIGTILWNQTVSVMDAAGMKSPASVLEWWNTGRAR